jgi:uncharacterized protein (DUF4415 family)
MAKRKARKPATENLSSMTPEEAVVFLESFRQLQEDKDEKTRLISLRIPENILRLLKAKNEGKKYQSLIIQILRAGIK